MKKIILPVLIILLLLLGGCSKVETTLHEGVDGDWSIEIPKKYEKNKEEQIEDYFITTYRWEMEDQSIENFSVSEVADKDAVVDENFFETEMGEDSYMKALKTEILDVDGFGKVYGVIGEDNSTKSYFIYYKTKINDKVISLISYRQKPFTDQEEKDIKEFISNIKKL